MNSLENKKEEFAQLIKSGLDLYEYQINKIPEDIEHDKLLDLLEPILKDLSKLTVIQGEAIISEQIKNRFRLKGREVTNYFRLLKEYRGEQKTASEEKVTLKGYELIADLPLKNPISLNPIQAFKDGKMMYAVKIKNTPCVINSQKNILTFEELQGSGFVLNNNVVDVSRFSNAGIHAFIKSEKTISIVDVFKQVRIYVEKYVIFPDPTHLDFISLWIMGTYVYSLFQCYPYVWINAEMDSGKTTLLKVVSSIAFNGEFVGNMSDAVLYRLVSQNRCALFWDEFERMKKEDRDLHQALLSILNTGYEDGGTTMRMEFNRTGPSEIKIFNTYSPKMFAGINTIDETLRSRTIKIAMLRKKPHEKVQEYERGEELLNQQQQIRDVLYYFGLVNGHQVANKYYKNTSKLDQFMEGLQNRERQLWKPIFILAELLDEEMGGNEVSDAIRILSEKSMREKMTERKDGDDIFKILSSVNEILKRKEPFFQKRGVKFYWADEVSKYLHENTGLFQTPHSLTSKLKRLGIRSEQKRQGEIKVRAYAIHEASFKDWCERYEIK